MFDESMPEVLAPVRWVNPSTGNDANNGQTPTAAYATLEHALTGNEVTQGTRIILEPGTYTENNFTVTCSTVGSASDAMGPVDKIPLVVTCETVAKINATITVGGTGIADGNGNYPDDNPIRFINVKPTAITLSGDNAWAQEF
jgi:hypothetical protein